MNTIHSVSNTSLVRSSEAVVVRNSFSFRSLMMRVMLVMAIMYGMMLESKTFAADGDNHTLFDVTTASNWEVSHASYTDTWTSNDCVFERAANNNKSWSYVRIGGKGLNNAIGYIGTTSATTYKTESLKYTIAQPKSNNSLTINSITLYVYGSYNSSTNVFSNELDHVSYTVSSYTGLSNNSTISFSPSISYGESCWASGVYFKLVFNLSNSNQNKNYGTDISKIVAVEGCGNAPSTYTVTYDPNGGTGTMTDNTNYASGTTVTVLANLFTAPDGMDFNGWNTEADGSGTYYDAGSTFTITANTTLYAQWITSGCRSLSFSSMGYTNGRVLNGTQINISSIINVTFNKASGTTAPTYYDDGTAIRAYANNTFTISTNNSSNITSIFLTFSSGGNDNGITANTGTYITANTGTYSMWVGSASSVTFTVGGESGHRRIASIRACTEGVNLLYDANGGTGAMIDSNNPYTSGSTVTAMTNDFIAPADMEFGGWNTASDGSGDGYAEGEPFTITSNTTLYAQWVTPSDAGCPEITFSEQGYSDQEEEPYAIFGDASEITVAFNKGDSDNAPKYFNNGSSIRAYAGSTITVSANGYYAITSIRLIFAEGGNNNTITSDVGTYNSGVWSGTASSVTFTIDGTSGQRRIAGIRVCTEESDCGGENFMDYEATAYNDLDGVMPTGWYSYNSDNDYTPRVSNNDNYSFIPNNDGKYLLLTTREEGQLVYAVMPMYSVITSVTFKYVYEDVDYGTFTVGYVTDNSGFATYTILKTPSKTDSWSTYSLSAADIETINNNNGYIAFRYESGSSTYYSTAIDNVVVCTTPPTSAILTYNANGAETGSVPDDSSYTLVDGEATVTVSGNTGNLVRPEYTFAGWNTAPDGSGASYQEDDTFTITRNTTLYAQWTPNQYTITWLANGHFISSHNFNYGSNIDVAHVPEDASVTSAMCDGSKILVGWSAVEFEKTNTPSATIITRDGFSDITVTGDQTYYAVFAIRTGSPETCTLITDASTLTEGDNIVIVAESYNYAISTTQNENNRGRASVLKENGGTSLRLPLGDDVCVFELRAGTSNGTWAFYDANYDDGNGGFIFAVGQNKKNYLRTQTPPNTANGSWTITISSNIATITANISGNNISNLLQYNNSQSWFSCYKSGQDDVVLYKKSGGYTYYTYTTFCPCAFDTDGITGDNNHIWTGKNVGDDWGLTSNWVVYNSSESEPKYHLAANEPTSSTKIYIIQSEDCNIVTPTVAEDATCGNFTINGLNIDIAENKTLTINGEATFTSGIINGNVTFGSSATVIDASTSSYVNGKVTKNGMSGAFTFPTGTASLYAPFAASSSAASNVSVQYAAGSEGMPDWWNHSGNLYNAGLHHASDRENWQISASATTTLSGIKLYWNTASGNYHSFEEDASDLNSYLNVAVVKKGGFYWQNLGKTEINGSFTGSGSITAAEQLTITVGAKADGDGEYFATFASSNGGAVVLPIELISFTAICNGRSSLIEWTTATEKNNDFFVLERSVDAINFKEIARIAGAGNSIESINYTYTDYGARSGDNYYRLVQVDYDGTSTASEIIVANCPTETLGEPDVLAFPNPFDDNLTLHFENFGNVQATIEVCDMLGRMVQTQKINCSQNDYEVVLRLAGLADGTYNVRISTKEFVINRQVIKN